MPGRPRRSSGWPARSPPRSRFCKDGVGVNGKSIMGVMMLAAECGSSHHHPGARRGRGAGRRGPRAARGRRVRRALTCRARSAGSACRPAWPSRRRWWCAATFPRCRIAPSVPTRSTSEVRRLREAVEDVVAPAAGPRVSACSSGPGPRKSRIFDAQILMAQDEEFLASVETLIRNNQLSAETAYEFKALELQESLVRQAPGCASGSPTCTPSRCGCCTG